MPKLNIPDPPDPTDPPPTSLELQWRQFREEIKKEIQPQLEALKLLGHGELSEPDPSECAPSRKKVVAKPTPSVE